MTREEFIPEFLSFLERREAHLLNWGFHDVAFDGPDVEVLLEDEGPADLVNAWVTLRGRGADMIGLLRDMARDGLLHFLPDERARFRTRFAEGVRLTARLRQLFRRADWATGPRLVSDVKLHLAPRRYPKRDQTVADCWADIVAEAAPPTVLQRAAFEAMARDANGTPFRGFAGFQRRAFARMLSRYGREGITGSVVSAGTGSGKTKAAYVPAFLGIVADIERNPAPFTKVIAVYPRNVLLGDQLREALGEAAKISPVLAARGLRPITFGALTGDTPPSGVLGQLPRDGQPSNSFLRNWARRQGAWRLPLVKSPRDGGSELLWRDIDRSAGRAPLYSVDDPNGEPHVADGVMRLTRDAIQAAPPDVLLLSIEMLHRELGNPAYAAAFGIRVGRGQTPRILLLDEIHTYEGLSGAQIPWVLRRWRFAARPAGLQVLGLSATLRDAKAHLAVVSGVPASRVDEFRPLEHPDPERSEFRSEGQEYSLLVKGNAASGAPLLATSIQCAMLMSRLLTPRHLAHGEPATGAALYARKVFGFTDNLDGINRWFADLYDAETNRGLARHRAPGDTAGADPAARAIERRRREEGQAWDLPAALGHDLHVAARVDRCSSQDAGVNAGADIVVATASLEVGYDDPDVGVTLHHKAPRSTASFLQRKGRAGRRRGTRPATIVVLSDYGRDRWSFQNSERLFEPGLERIALPALNPYVLRIQTTAFLIDWLGRRIGSPNPFSYLRRPDAAAKAAQSRARKLLGEMLDGGPAFAAFRDNLVALIRPALADHGMADRADAVVDGILWDEPRPVLRHAVPALLRKLEAGWSHADPLRAGLLEDVGRTRPIPDYLPASSFAPLDGIEVALRFPGRPRKGDEALDAGRALFEACPGRVSKRYSVERREGGYWLAASTFAAAADDGEDPVASVGTLFADFVRVGTAEAGTPVYQPLALDLVEKPTGFSDSSDARWEWRTRMESVGPGSPLPVFIDRAFSPSLGPVTAHLHSEEGGVRVLRHASSARFEMRYSDGRIRRGRLRLAAGGENADGAGSPEAVGFEQAVDGIRVDLVSSALSEVPALDDAAVARLRPDYFLDLLRSDDLVAHRAGSFMIDWLWQTSMAMLAATAATVRCSLPEASRRLVNRRVEAAARVLDRIFGGMPADDGDEDGFAPGAQPGRARQRDRLLDLWRDPQVVARVEAAETALWSDPRGPEFNAWLRSRHLATVAQALRAAVLGLSPEIAEDDVIVDLVTRLGGGADANAPGVAAYVTETGPGGLGQIEAVAMQMRAEPEAFEDAFRRALDHCPRESSSSMMRHIAQAARRVGGRGDPEGLAAALGRVREARGHADAEDARRTLAAALDAEGVEPTRDALVAVISRLARPGSGPVSDALTRGLNRAWDRCELRLGMAVDPRVFAYLCVERPGLRRRLIAFLRRLGGVPPVDHQLYAAVRDMLLPGCVDACPECLDRYHRFGGLASPSRDLARRWLGLGVTRLDVEPGFAWIERARASLRDEGRVALRAPASLTAHAGRGLQILLAGEIEREFVMAPVSLAGVSRAPGGWTVLLHLRAAAHV